MPRRCEVDPLFEHLVHAQDLVVSRGQALCAGLSDRAIEHRLASGGWQVLLPGVYLCHPGEAARRQRLMAALLYCGNGSAIDAEDACRYHGIKGVSVDDEIVHVAVPPDSPARSRWWVVVRRAAHFSMCSGRMLRYVDPATAVIAVTRAMSSPRAVLAVMSRKGVRSVPEAEFRILVEAMPSLPPLHYNRLLRMPDGRKLSPDALAPDAPLIHETNGRVAHAREDLFEDMQARHDYLTTWGFTVLHNPPRRIRDDGRVVVGEFARCYERLAGSGWPPGVMLLPEDVI